RVVELEKARERPAVERSRVEPRLARGRGETVPRAHFLAHVTAEHPIADQRPQLTRNQAAMLDREVRDAEPRVDLIGRDDRAGRAAIETAPARAAVLALERRIRLERPIDEHFAQQEERA